MTFVGKVLVVVNVVLTVCIAMFAAGVFAVQTSWWDKYKTLAEAKSNADKANSEQITGKDKLIKELDEKWKKARDAGATAQSNYDLEKTARDADDAKHKNTIADYEKKVSVYAVLDQDNKAKLKELENLRVALAELHKKLKALSNSVTKLEDDKYGLQRQQKQVAKKYNAMLEILVVARKLLQKNKIKFDPASVAGLEILPDPAEGIVTDVLHGNRNKATLVEVSVGSDDGVTKGLVLHVYRLTDKGKYLGKIRIITEPLADKAFGELIDDAKQGLIKKGDHVAAKLKF